MVVPVPFPVGMHYHKGLPGCVACCLPTQSARSGVSVVAEVLLVVEVGWGENSYVTSRPLPFGVWCGLAIGSLGFRDGSRLFKPWGLGAPRGGARKLLSLSAVSAVCVRSSFGCSRTLVGFLSAVVSGLVRFDPVRSPAAQAGAVLLLGGMCCVCVVLFCGCGIQFMNGGAAMRLFYCPQ